jgi:hypothetical protein
MTNDTMISDDPAAIDEQQAQYATTQVTTAEAVPTAPVEQVIPFAPMEGFVPTASVEQAEEFGPLAPIDEAIPVQQSGQAVPLAFNTLLGRHAQEAVKFVDEFDSAPDALTKLSVLVDLEEHLEDWKKLIESERAPLEHERNQDVLIGLKQFAADNDFDSVEKMLADLGIVVSPFRIRLLLNLSRLLNPIINRRCIRIRNARSINSC